MLLINLLPTILVAIELVTSENVNAGNDTISISISCCNIMSFLLIPTDSNIAQGESIETSGLGGIYPKGIHVGSIKRVVNTKNATDRYAIVETAVDFDKLDTVLVIVNN